MGKLVVTEFVTLDGVMEDPGGAEKSRYGGWSLRFFSDEAAKFKFDELSASDAQLLGRKTYEGFAAAWPSMQDEFADRMNGMPKYVVSTTLQKAEWNNSQIIRDNVVEQITRLKRQPGRDLLVAGSRTLVQTLMQHGLVDEFRLLVHPIVLGDGLRLFGDTGGAKTMNLVECKPFSSGVVALTYAAGAGSAE
ncbi:MAG TPA: dihydrofolate reductase family protein [Dehalococcoidia bacterium]|nr:dihydrofolate reductase family protein [Dehalococcoidia bacterium]